MPNIRWLLALVTVVHRWLYRVSGGRIGARASGMDVLLLETTGRRSGQRRVTPLLYVTDGEHFVVVASNAGDDRDPAWWLNLRAKPDAAVQVRAERHAVRARRADDEEATRLWPRLDAAYSYYPAYRKRTSREIPVVILERSGAAAP